MSKMHEKFAFQKIKMKPTQIAIKSYILSTISKRFKFLMQFS